MEETGELFPKAGIKLPAGYKLPRGYYFNPSDYDVICYLQCKAMEEQSPCEGAMADVDLYGDKEPWEIFEDFELKKSGHFFSRFKDNVRKIGVNGGVWKAVDGAEKVIYDDEFNNKEIGRSRAFVYSNDNVQQQNDYRWLMTEYVLSGDTLTDPKLKHSDYAVCFIRKKNANGDDDDSTDHSEDDYISNYDDDDDDVMDDSDLEEDAIDRSVRFSSSHCAVIDQINSTCFKGRLKKNRTEPNLFHAELLVEADVYGQKERHGSGYIPRLGSEKSRHFFTRLKKKRENCIQISRKQWG